MATAEVGISQLISNSIYVASISEFVLTANFSISFVLYKFQFKSANCFNRG